MNRECSERSAKKAEEQKEGMTTKGLAHWHAEQLSASFLSCRKGGAGGRRDVWALLILTSYLTRRFARWLGSRQGSPGPARPSSRASSFPNRSHSGPSKPQCSHLPEGTHGLLRLLNAMLTVVTSPGLDSVCLGSHLGSVACTPAV